VICITHIWSNWRVVLSERCLIFDLLFLSRRRLVQGVTTWSRLYVMRRLWLTIGYAIYETIVSQHQQRREVILFYGHDCFNLLLLSFTLKCYDIQRSFIHLYLEITVRRNFSAKNSTQTDLDLQINSQNNNNLDQINFKYGYVFSHIYNYISKEMVLITMLVLFVANKAITIEWF